MVTTKGVFVTTKGALVEVLVATHSKVLPTSVVTDVGQTTVACRWRSLRMLASIEDATAAVSTGFVVVVLVEDEEDEPHAPSSAAQASAATAPMPPRRTRSTRTVVGVVGFMCMRAY